jgi:hypothetical protein
VTRAQGWTEAARIYRKFVYEAGLRQVKDQPHATLDAEEVEAAMADPSLMRKQRWLSEGWVVGSRAFVRHQLQGYLAKQSANAGPVRWKEFTVQHDCVAMAGRGRTTSVAADARPVPA